MEAKNMFYITSVHDRIAMQQET